MHTGITVWRGGLAVNYGASGVLGLRGQLPWISDLWTFHFQSSAFCMEAGVSDRPMLEVDRTPE